MVIPGCVFLGESENGFVISDHSDHAASNEQYSSVPLMWHDPNDLRSQIRFRILPKKHPQFTVLGVYNNILSRKVLKDGAYFCY